MSRILSAFAFVLAFAALAQTGAAQSVGDRLVVAVNGVPYTQRQVEIYIHVKESLRKSAPGAVRLVSAGNWSDAITVFTEDMTILQESQRLGSFSASDQAFDKYVAVVKQKTAESGGLRAALARLGADEATVARSLQDVLRVAAFRRSKELQHEPAKKEAATDRAAARREDSKWLDDLTARAVTRRFEGADTYMLLSPVTPR